MVKWEYLFITCSFTNDQWRPQYVNGVQITNWEMGADAYSVSNHVGEFGWELIGLAITGSDQDRFRLTFKRPR